MTVGLHPSLWSWFGPCSARPAWPACPSRPARRGLAGLLRTALLAVVVLGALGAGVARADPAPEPWQPSPADLTRVLRPCPITVAGAAQPVCWSMTEDTTAWMAQPPGSPYPWAQCTYYAGLMRPDIWNDRAPPAADPLYQNWDAWTWVEHAQAEGLAVDEDPQPGDVIVYSRAAVGNDTGHVAIVTAVDGTDPATGGLRLTVSEMNVGGLDDASQGQGDTSTVIVPRSQLQPGMIQFIHQPGPGYVAPAWPGGYEGQGAVAAPAAPDPSLAVAVFGDHLATVSRSIAPVQATVTAEPGGAVVKRETLAANQIIDLALPAGAYTVCVSQAAAGQWPAAARCVNAVWRTPGGAPAAARAASAGARHDATLALRRLRLSARGLTVSLVLGSPLAAHTLAALVTVQLPGAPAATARVRTAARTVVRIRHGRALVTLRLPARSLARRHAVLRVRVPAQTVDGIRIAALSAALTL